MSVSSVQKNRLNSGKNILTGSRAAPEYQDPFLRPERDPALAVIIPEYGTAGSEYLGHEIIPREHGYQEPDDADVHHQAAYRDYGKRGELPGIIPVPVMECQVLVQAVTDKRTAAVGEDCR